MIMRIQYCVDVTGDDNFKWAVRVAPNHYTLQELFDRIQFTRVNCFYLNYFKIWCTLHINTSF